MLPVGTEVRVVRGPHEGLQGLVSSLHPGGQEQPSVRLFLDARGQPLDTPIEIALANEPETAVEVIEVAEPLVVPTGRRRRPPRPTIAS